MKFRHLHVGSPRLQNKIAGNGYASPLQRTGSHGCGSSGTQILALCGRINLGDLPTTESTIRWLQYCYAAQLFPHRLCPRHGDAHRNVWKKWRSRYRNRVRALGASNLVSPLNCSWSNRPQVSADVQTFFDNRGILCLNPMDLTILRPSNNLNTEQEVVSIRPYEYYSNDQRRISRNVQRGIQRQQS
jgi:hypothetical protein